jgi:antitoxin component YwqK of YwqJK toxin-antitoxin module
MKRLFLLFCLVCFILPGFAQEITDTHINKVDSQGRRQGMWRIYDVDGNLKFTGEFQNGKPRGTLHFYYPSGNIKAEILQIDSGRVSYARNFYSNGNLMATGKYVEQLKDSTWLYYSEEEGTLASEEFYKNGRKEGVWKIYYPDGKVAEETSYSRDMKDGPWLQYFTDGSLKQKATHSSGKLEGSFIIYHLNGKVEVSGTYQNDDKHGTWVYLTDLGELVKKEEYIHGKLITEEVGEIDK